MRSLCCPQMRTQFINLCPQSRSSSNEDSGVIRRTTSLDWITIQQSKISQMANYKSCSTLDLSWNVWSLIKTHAAVQNVSAWILDAQNVCLQLISGQPNDPYPTPIMYDWLQS